MLENTVPFRVALQQNIEENARGNISGASTTWQRMEVRKKPISRMTMMIILRRGGTIIAHSDPPDKS
jgi:hypothetical protein